MTQLGPLMRRRTVLATLVAIASVGAHAQPASAPMPIPVRIRGTILSQNSAVLTVATNAGDTVKIALAPNYTVGAVVPASLESIKPGSKIGIVGFGPPKQQRAAVISIFPPGAAVNEAQFAWDSQPDSVMTNAPVTSQVVSSGGRTLTVTVKGEPIEVTVPQTVIIQTTEPGTPAMLVPGAHVLVFAQRAADGSLAAPRVNVGKDGFVPAS